MGRKRKITEQQISFVIQQHIDLTQKEIAEQTGLCLTTVRQIMRQQNLETKKSYLKQNRLTQQKRQKEKKYGNSLTEFTRTIQAIQRGKPRKEGTYCPHPSCIWLCGSGNRQTCFWKTCLYRPKDQGISS